MPRRENQKQRLLVLLKLLTRETDEHHRMSVPEILDELQKRGIAAERKSIYADVETLRDLGYSIELQRGRGGGYYMAEGLFQLPELKLLADAVQASKIISRAKSRELIGKLEQFTSRYQAQELQRQVLVSGRVKTPNEKIYYLVDTLHEAINKGLQICFRYRDWDLHKRLTDRHNGRLYRTSPWALVWESGNYYLIAYENGSMRHYRVDKMDRIQTLKTPREGKQAYSEFDVDSYVQPLFGMFGGTPIHVTLQCENRFIGAIIDRFGTVPILIPCADGTHFRIQVKAVPSPQFYGWVAGFGGGVEIVSPSDIRQKMAEAMQLVWMAHSDAAPLEKITPE